MELSRLGRWSLMNMVAVIGILVLSGCEKGFRSTQPQTDGEASLSASYIARPSRILSNGATLAFKSPEQTVKQGACSQALQVQLLNSSGLPQTFKGSVQVSLAASPSILAFYSDSACSTAVSSFTLYGNTGSGQFYFLGQSAGSSTVSVNLLGLTTSQSEVVEGYAPAPAQYLVSSKPAELSFAYQIGAMAPTAQSVKVIDNALDPVPFSATTDKTWLSVTPNSGTTAAYIDVSVNTSNLAAGTYKGNVVITGSSYSNSGYMIPVTLIVSAAGPALPPVSGVCPRGTLNPDDGCSKAIPTGSFQVPGFFTGFTGKIFFVRPPWNVAGVDYPVGYDTRLTLKDPLVASNLPSCASIVRTAVRIDSAPCTIEGFDFSSHGGVCLYMSSSISNGQLITIQNNKFGGGPNCNPNGGSLIGWNSATFDLLIQYNELDAKLSPDLSQLIGNTVSGKVLVQYNALLNTPQHTMHMGAPNIVTQYNYASGVGVAPNHGDYLYFENGFPTGSWISRYETVYAKGNATALCYLTPDNDFVNAECRNNVYVTTFDNGKHAVSRIIDLGWPYRTVQNANISNNYYDATGSLLGFFGNQGLVANQMCSGNINMLDGKTLVTSGSSTELTCN